MKRRWLLWIFNKRLRPIICRLFWNITIKVWDVIMPPCTYAEKVYLVKSDLLEEYLLKSRTRGIRNQVVEKGLKQIYSPLLNAEATNELKKIFKWV